jgi:hypothetical protein
VVDLPALEVDSVDRARPFLELADELFDLDAVRLLHVRTLPRRGRGAAKA